MVYTVKHLARFAGVSVRTLHYSDHIELLIPSSNSSSGYRQHNEDSVLWLQQIQFFRELDFSLDEIRSIVTQPDFNVREALESHRVLLEKKAQRIAELLRTVNKTIKKFEGVIDMDIKEYYEGFSDAQIEEYRNEARQRWDEDAVGDSESRVVKMGKQRVAEIRAEGEAIFQAMTDLMPKGAASPEVQEQVAKWRQWLEHFSTYSDEVVLGLARMYSKDSRFAAFYEKYHADLPPFFTRAVEHYCSKTSGRQ